MELLRVQYASESEIESVDIEKGEPLGDRDTRKVYLVTYSQADLVKFPSRYEFAMAIVNSFTHGRTKVIQWCCCMEDHKTCGKHYHIALKLNRVQRWLASKRYLKDHYDITVHYSSKHHNYYSAWQYVTKSDQEYLQSERHPDLRNSNEPRTATASRAKRQSRKLHELLTDEFEMSASESEEPPKKRKQKKRLSAFDVSEIIQNKNIKTITELQALAQQQKTEGKTDLAEFILSRSPRLVADILNTSWQMLNADKKLTRSMKSRLELLQDASHAECVPGCKGNWLTCAEEVLRHNRVDIFEFAEAIHDLLEKGRGKFRNIMIIGPANCAKTFLLNPLNDVYKTFSNPATGRFAWVGCDQAECIFLNDFRWSQDMIPWHDLLLLLEGQEVHLPAPKTHFAEDILFDKDTPIFATSKQELIYVKNGIVDTRETEMMKVRWKVFTFFHQMPQERQRELVPCPRCFARLVIMKPETEAA